MLKALSKRFRVKLFCYVDDYRDLEYTDRLSEYTDEVYFELLPRWKVFLRAVKAFILHQSITEAVYFSNSMMSAINHSIETNNIRSVIAFSSSMGQYLPYGSNDRFQTFIDYVDVDSLKWRDYGKRASIPMRWVYKREAKLLGDLENTLHKRATIGSFVTDAERELFYSELGIRPQSLKVIGNGVDINFFDPEGNYPSPYKALGISDVDAICFVGAMDYYANEDAVIWFMKDVLPLILKKRPECCFLVVGRDPSDRLRRLAISTPGVLVTGAVADVRPYLKYCALVVAPLRIARGMQNKVLEALAMNKQVLATTVAAEGVDIDGDANCLHSCASSGEMAEAALLYLSQGTVGVEARKQVVKHYAWAPQMEKFLDLVKC